MSYTVAFTDNSHPGPSGPITAWAWEFGDGGTSSSQNPTHAYASTGNYSVRLTVTGSGSDGTASITSPITVLDTGVLNSYFSYSVSGLAVTFTDLSVAGPSGPITAWAWDFGDSNTSTSQNPSNTYAAAGTYTVTLTVTGTAPDGTAESSQTVTVTNASPNFVAATDWARPSFTPVRTVNFTTKAQLDAAIADLTAGDYIHYTGTGVLRITAASAAYIIQNKNPASTVVIDFGTSHSIWDPSSISGNYVAFSDTAGTQTSALVVKNCSKLRIYGGDITCTHGYGIEIDGPCSNLLMWDQYVHHVGGSGLWVRDYVSGVVTYVRDSDFRMEVNRFCLDPSKDSHGDKGTGHHGMLLHGNTGETSGNTFTCYAHDPLTPGETSFGTVWPEGSGGSAVEAGHNAGNGYQDNTYYVLGENLLMEPDGTNPGSNGVKQAGGNVLQFWGGDPLDNNVVGWVEGRNCTGGVVHCASGGAWDNASPAITVDHGRHSNVNQYTGNSSQSGANGVPYNLAHGIVYNDCT